MAYVTEKTENDAKAIRLAIIAARGGSKGLPGKNLAEIGGRSLVRRAVDSAVESGAFDLVICSTDCEKIAASAAAGGAEIPFMRPAELSTDTATSMDAVFHAAEFIMGQRSCEIDLLCLLEPTTPLRSSADVAAAVKLLAENSDSDAVVSVSDAGHAHPAWMQAIQDGHLERYFDDSIMPMPTRRQDFDKIKTPWLLNGAIYIARWATLKSAGSFLGSQIKTLAFRMPPERSVNIDTELDLITARAFWQHCH